MDIVDRFEQQAKSNPNSTAIIDRDTKYSYQDFYFKINSIANHLNELNIEHPKVMIDLPQGINAYATMYATLVSGGFYCPINTDIPKERKKQIYSQFSPDVIATDQEISDFYKNSIHLDPDQVTHDQHDPVKKEPHELCYVIFTSGSTGIPKGVMIRRKSVSKFIDWAITSSLASAGDRWGQFSNLGFDLSVMDIYTALGSGATLVPINNQRHRLNPAKAINKYDITIWHSVPSVIDLMDKMGQITEVNLKSLRLMSFCGEPLRPQHLRKLFFANPEMTVFNTYGPTEGTVFFTWIPLRKDSFETDCDSTVAIGKPIPGWNLTLIGGKKVDEGEIVIYGEYIGAGYWQDVARTSQVFKPIDIGGEVKPAYYTGDWAELKDGNLYFRQRIDRQVKIHGFRVELEEIESVIRDYGVTNCRVIYDSERIYAFLESSTEIDLDLLKKHISARLPHYEVPSYFYMMDMLPRNHNDKTDISILKDMINRGEQ